MKKYRTPRSIVSDGLRAYLAAMNEIGVAAERHEVGGRLNNRAENPISRFGDANGRCSASKSEDAAEIQLSSCPGAQPIQSGAPFRHEASRSVALTEWRTLAA
jgi:transposase-like protein